MSTWFTILDFRGFFVLQSCYAFLLSVIFAVMQISHLQTEVKLLNTVYTLFQTCTWIFFNLYPGKDWALIFFNLPLLHIHAVTHIHTSELPCNLSVILMAAEQLHCSKWGFKYLTQGQIDSSCGGSKECCSLTLGGQIFLAGPVTSFLVNVLSTTSSC